MRLPLFLGVALAVLVPATSRADVNLSVNFNQVTLAASLGSATPVHDTSVVLTNNGSSATAFTFNVVTKSGGSWLTVSTTEGAPIFLIPGGSVGLTISADPTDLAESPGYFGTITISGGGSTVTVEVEFQIINGQVITATPRVVTKTLLPGTTAQLQAAVYVDSPSGGNLTYQATPSTEMGLPWLSLSTSLINNQGTTSDYIGINLDATNLPLGQYRGYISLQCTENVCNQPAVAVTLNVAPPLGFTNTSLPDGVVGGAYLQTPAVNGAPPYIWSLIGGNLPQGLSLSPTTGTISGTPLQVGTSHFTLLVVDSTGAGAEAALTLTIDPSHNSLTRTGVLSQVASGGGWKTSIYLINTSATPVAVNVNLWSDGGSQLSLPLTVKLGGSSQTVTSSTVSEIIPSHASLVIETSSASATSLTGWAEILGTSPVEGYGVFHYTSGSGIQSEGTVPLESEFQPSFLLPYDNVSGFGSGVALANLSTSQQASIAATIWDAQGNSLPGQTIILQANGHESFTLSNRWPALAANRGLIQFSASGGNVTGLGLRVNPLGGFTSTPKLSASSGSSGTLLTRSGVLSQVASAGGWKSSIYLVNTSATPSAVTVNLWADDGSALSLPLNVTQSGGSKTVTAATLSATIAPKATLLIETTATAGSSVAGWVEVLSNGPISGYGVFHYTSTKGDQSEGTVALESAFTSSFLLPYDNLNQFQTGVALANLLASQKAGVSGTVLDVNGAPIGSISFNLLAGGHYSFLLNGELPAALGNRGYIEFTTSSGGNLTGLGLRVNPAGGFTSIPKLQPR